MPFDQTGQRSPLGPHWLMVAVVLAAFGYMAYSLADRLTFHPSVYPDGLWEHADSLQAKDVQLTASDAESLHAWFIASKQSPAAARTVFLHGNAGNLSHRIAHIEAITRAGSDVLIVDYRGYGKSKGSPSESGLYLDALAAYDWLAEQHDGKAPIVCHGESIGSAVATDLATRRSCAGLILEAPLSSRADVAALVMPVIGPLLARGFDTARKITAVNSPVLVIHGSNDRVIPQRLGKTVFEAASGPKEFWNLAGAGHNDILSVAGEEYVRRLSAFYRGLRS